jgi:hypothetical protein
VDKPLTPQQQAEMRSRSSRATITATSLINEYHWGNLKGDSLDWMQRYFDAHVYSANCDWGHCSLILRLPLKPRLYTAHAITGHVGCLRNFPSLSSANDSISDGNFESSSARPGHFATFS